MSDEHDDWKEKLIRSRTEARRFFSNAGKHEREKWVARVFLTRIELVEMEQKLQIAPEPYDVRCGDANFQIKEVLPEGRKRQAEYAHKLEAAKMATCLEDTRERWDQTELSGAEIFRRVVNCERALVETNAYGTREYASMDLLVYVNFPKACEVEGHRGVLKESKFRSVSYLSNRYAAVIFASEAAPAWLRSRVAILFDKRPDGRDE